jgi:hypothetical protein
MTTPLLIGLDTIESVAIGYQLMRSGVRAGAELAARILYLGSALFTNSTHFRVSYAFTYAVHAIIWYSF